MRTRMYSDTNDFYTGICILSYNFEEGRGRRPPVLIWKYILNYFLRKVCSCKLVKKAWSYELVFIRIQTFIIRVFVLCRVNLYRGGESIPLFLRMLNCIHLLSKDVIHYKFKNALLIRMKFLFIMWFCIVDCNLP